MFAHSGSLTYKYAIKIGLKSDVAIISKEIKLKLIIQLIFSVEQGKTVEN